MTPDKPMTLADLFPLPEGVKLRSARFGSAPPTEFRSLPPPPGPTGGTDDHPPFRQSWQDRELGLTVLVTEEPDGGKLVAQVFSTDPAHLGTAAVSVALVGKDTDDMIRKTVPLSTPLTAGPDKCSGQEEFGSLEDARKRLGNELSIVAFLLV